MVIKYGFNVSVLYGRCLHRGALMADGHIEGHNLICGVHGWDYCYDTRVSEYNNSEVLDKFYTEIKDHWVWVATNNLIKVVARACGHNDVTKFNFDDLSQLINTHIFTTLERK